MHEEIIFIQVKEEFKHWDEIKAVRLKVRGKDIGETRNMCAAIAHAFADGQNKEVRMTYDNVNYSGAYIQPQ